MIAQADTFRETVLEEWTNDRTVHAWRNWHPKILIQLREMTEAHQSCETEMLETASKSAYTTVCSYEAGGCQAPGVYVRSKRHLHRGRRSGSFISQGPT